MELRTCKTCGEAKDILAFYRRHQCKTCRQFIRNGGRLAAPKISKGQVIVFLEGLARKHCNACSVEKPLAEFNKNHTAITGYTSYCNTCINVKKRAAIQKNPEKHRTAKRLWEVNNYARHREGDRRRHVRYNAKPEKKAARKIRGDEWRKLHPEACALSSKRRTAEYSSAYVAQCLYVRTKVADRPEIPVGLIDGKREVMRVFRELKATTTPPTSREYSMQYRKQNAEAIKARRSAYDLANVEKKRAYRVAYFANNKEKIAAYNFANKEAIKAAQVAYRLKHKERIAARDLAYRRARRAKLAATNGEIKSNANS